MLLVGATTAIPRPLNVVRARAPAVVAYVIVPPDAHVAPDRCQAPTYETAVERSSTRTPVTLGPFAQALQLPTPSRARTR